ncbi:MAG: hypothetical protein KatS3mg105_2800 [Gemmatales bacterium]|nr:MAG: hypothetical protein KatS3mg105_2800 [Gemmatales bacterium]
MLALALVGSLVSVGVGWVWRESVLVATSKGAEKALQETQTLLDLSDEVVAELKAEVEQRQRTYPLLFLSAVLALAGGSLAFRNRWKFGRLSSGVIAFFLLFLATTLPTLTAPNLVWFMIFPALAAFLSLFIRQNQESK